MNRISISNELTQQMVKEIHSSADSYTLTREIFAENLEVGIANKDYWECVRVVKELEASIINYDNPDYIHHNSQIRSILDDVLASNAIAIRELQINQSRWEQGDKQLIPPPEKVESVVIPHRQLVLVVPNFHPEVPRKKSVVNFPEQELEIDQAIEKCKNLIIKSMIDDAKALIQSFGDTLKNPIKAWLVHRPPMEKYNNAMAMIASL
ncbi:MAG: hypothetical protein RLZZ176_2337 [Cyanobacteriota bacterium]